MKQHSIYILLIIIILFSQQQNSQAQDNLHDSNPILTSGGLTYQDIIDSLSCKDRSFEDKYALVTSIKTIQPFDKILNIYNNILSQSKSQTEKKYVLSLYAAIANNYLSMNTPDIAKQYLDSAYQYINHTKDSGSIGVYYFIEGRYYANMQDELSMVNSYYKSISYFSQDDRRKQTIMMLLYAIGGYYYQYKDVQSLEKIKNQMLELAKKINQPTSSINSYSIAAAYYDISWGNDSIQSHRDSVIYYNKQIINEYDNADAVSKDINADLVVQSYLNMAEFMINNINTRDCTYTWDEIIYCITNSKNLRKEHDIAGLFRYYYLQAKVYAYYGKYEEGIQYAKKSLEIISQEQTNILDKINLSNVYALLVKLEEQNGDYKDALKYLKLLFDLQEDIQNDKKYKVGKELEIKYETAKKDLEIVTLQVEKEREKQNKTLILGIGLLIIILLVIFLLYNRIQRLKKEKEASALSIRMKEKELEFQSAMAQSELNAMQSYLKGLETERERLAKELHDNIANELLSIDFQLKDIKQVPEETSAQIENLHTEIRNISHELIPPLFKYAGLPEIISDYVSKANKNNIDIDLQIEESSDHISEKQALEIYRIIQEATSNIVKHAEATTAKISLWRSGSFLKLSIEDNGKGFDINRKQAGIGLQIIKDRVVGLNGVFQIYSLPDSGCKIDISIPISQSNGDK